MGNSALRRFDRLILACVLGLALGIAALSMASARLGPAVDHLATAQLLDGTSVTSQIDITFTAPMNIRSVERSFRLQPSVPGDFSWSGNEMVWTPRRALTYGTRYTVTIGASARGAHGKPLVRPYRNTFTTQSQHLLYLASDHRLMLASVEGSVQPVGVGGVTDFSASYDGSLAAYVRRGSPHERPDEVWLLSLADDSTQRVFRRPDWDISQPHLSPDGHYIVFLATNVRLCQKYYGCYRDTSGPVIYLYDLRAHKLEPFKASSDAPITNFIEFSPAGQLAYTDSGSSLVLAQPNGGQIIHVPNGGNSLLFAGFDVGGDKAAFVGQTPSSSGGEVMVYDHGTYLDVSHGVYDSSTPAFSASGAKIAYAGYRSERGIEPVYGINVYTFSTHRTRYLPIAKGWSDWTPVWSPDGRYLAFVRSRPQEAMYMGWGRIWVTNSAGKRGRPLGSGSDPQWVG